MSQSNRTLAIRWFEEVWNKRNAATIDELMAPESIGHMEGNEMASPDDFRAARLALLGAFPDFRITVDDAIEDGSNVVVRWHAAGTHHGDALGIMATQLPVTFRGMTWLRFENGRIVEGWDAWNHGAMVERLHVAAAKRAAPASA